jgi:uncharacterized protein YkwD
VTEAIKRRLVSVTRWPYAGLSEDALASELEVAVNRHRRAKGLAALTSDPSLAAVCLLHAKRMRDYSFFAHVDPHNGTGALERLLKADRRDWSLVAENIAAGQWTAPQVFEGWLGSSGHRANLEHSNVALVGTAIALGGEFHTYVVQVYAATRDGAWRHRRR